MAAERLGLSVIEMENAPAYWYERGIAAVMAERWAENRQHEDQKAQIRAQEMANRSRR